MFLRTMVQGTVRPRWPKHKEVRRSKELVLTLDPELYAGFEDDAEEVRGVRAVAERVQAQDGLELIVLVELEGDSRVGVVEILGNFPVAEDVAIHMVAGLIPQEILSLLAAKNGHVDVSRSSKACANENDLLAHAVLLF